MPLSEGTRLGAYEITGTIGAGGMGEVYRAHDTKLGRDIAIKTLPVSLADDADRLARFEREARLLASLNHAHIASVYGLDDHDGTRYIAMELIDGETLEERLKRAPLAPDDALQLALQIALALEAAHEKGVVHRDLKPANVMLTRDGVVKVLDFGLAKAFSGDPDEANPGQSPALSLAMTQAGLILGTAGYMSPEQAAGQATDQRADIWSFGVVLYEMLTGMPLFSGESVPHVLAAVLQTEPDWSRLPENLHPRIRQLLERCLQKKVRNRYHSIADARVDIETVLADPAGVLAARQEDTVQTARRSPFWPIAAGVASLAAVVFAGAWLVVEDTPESPGVIRFEHHLPADLGFTIVGRTLMDVSPDGRLIVYATDQGLKLLSTSEFTARPLATPDDGVLAPEFSPDGNWIAYWSSEARQIQKIQVTGGAPVVITDQETAPVGMSWSTNGRIVFSDNGRLMSVSENGGIAELLLAGPPGRVFPDVLPDGSGVLFTEGSAASTDNGQSDIALFRFGAETSEVLFGGAGAQPRYVASGHIVYESGSALFARPFDPETLAVGGPVPLVDDVVGRQYALSPSGTLVYLPGRVSSLARNLVWVDRNGNELPLDAPERRYSHAQLSPDGTTVAAYLNDGQQDIYTLSLERGILTRLTFDPEVDWAPVWSPDGSLIAYTNGPDTAKNLYLLPANGSADAEALTTGDGYRLASAFTPDGAELIYGRVTEENGWDIEMISLDGERRITTLLSTPFSERNADISPDGRWMAYESDESGDWEVYVRPFPEPAAGGRWQVSAAGGSRPVWSADGEELFYLLPPVSIMSVPVEVGETFTFGPATELFTGPYVTSQSTRAFDVSADSQQFLMIRDALANNSVSTIEGERAHLKIVLNWLEELRERVPVE